jgi:hypothetical protein
MEFVLKVYPESTVCGNYVLWFGYGMFPKVSCAGSLVPNTMILRGGEPCKRQSLVGGDWAMTTFMKGVMLVSLKGLCLDGMDWFLEEPGFRKAQAWPSLVSCFFSCHTP